MRMRSKYPLALRLSFRYFVFIVLADKLCFGNVCNPKFGRNS